MDTDRIIMINNIVKDIPHRLREGYFINNHSEVYNTIIIFCFKIPEIPFKQKIWHYVNNIDSYYLCNCGNKTSFNKNWKDGYREFCSQKCAQVDKKTKDKRRKTNLSKYGVDNVSKDIGVKLKKENTNIDRYGYKSSFSNKKVRDKWRKTIIDRYGVDHYFKTDDFKIKSKKYYLEKWGVQHQLNVDIIKDKIKNTCLDKYGVTTYLNTEHSRSSIKKYNRSSHEVDICSWLDSISVRYIINDRKIIKPLSIDILIDNYKLAIEFNGLYWHSEFFKDRKYHLNKTIKCLENGITLMHIWEDDWINRKEIIKSIILNKIKKTPNKIYARNCKVLKVNNKETSLFLNKNHIQGYSKFSESIGLYHDNVLVSIMCFGWRSINGKREYELIRFCNEINKNVVGSASKLFSFFIKNNDVDSIISYADVSIFDGSLYEKLGFKYLRRSDINYWWVVNGIRRHRFSYNKKKLVKNGFDPLKTEVEIMHENNSYRVYGCGQYKWVWCK